MTLIYKANNFPILQNRVYQDKFDAINCPKGNIVIEMDNSGFVSNSEFDESKMVYDQEYDNSVPSDFFIKYYERIGKYLIEKYHLNETSTILDIGCGKGTFLNLLYDSLKYKGKAIGIDPSYEGNLIANNGKLTFVKEYFNEKHLEEINSVSLVLLRHTLEHIPYPKAFLKELFYIFESKNLTNIPIFIEVPDLDWIMENKAYWDFFYEHVNYFTKSSLLDCIEDAKGIATEIKNEFGSQYIWAEASINSSLNKKLQIPLKEVSFDFSNEIKENVNKLKMAIAPNTALAIWGMASKGIIYTLHLKEYNIEPRYLIDINSNKQNKYIPLLGYQILAPENLPKDKELSIICMNPNYYKEIYDTCVRLALKFTLYTPNLEQINF
ncbi:MAG: class I SAM-dependent methyltransferase [Chitinophagales bacterium]|jgi:SAM-dependent methyltransferase|nr:class I SAM-dependent methyltransferase [Chitinophagales bacterium]